MKLIFSLLFSLVCLLAEQEKTSTPSPRENTLQNEANNETEVDKTKNLASSKSGFVIGIEALFGSSITEETQGESSSSSVMGGLYVGYQHYFDENLGLRALFHIHDGTPILGSFSSSAQSIQTSALPFWLGTELDLLWDFWQGGDHTLGLSGGLGYNFEIYHAREVKINNTSFALPSTYQHNLYPILSLHYYFGQHQISLNYRFIGTLNSSIKTYQAGGVNFKTHYSFKDYFNLSYFYRF